MRAEPKVAWKMVATLGEEKREQRAGKKEEVNEMRKKIFLWSWQQMPSVGEDDDNENGMESLLYVEMWSLGGKKKNLCVTRM